MAAKYPQEDYVEDGKESKNQPQYGESHALRTPIEANSIVVDTSDAKEDQNIKAQVAKVYYRSWSEGSDGSSSNSSLNVESSNFAKLFLLSTNICQDVMREIIRKKNPKGPTDADLHNMICASDTLRQSVKRYTSEDMLLFPKGEETVRYEQLDFSAMYKVARFAIPKQIAPNKSWSCSPNSGSNCLMSCIEKLRKFRNDCSHSPRGSIVKSNFESNVNEVTAVILQIETLLHTPNKYSLRVRRLTKASLSPRVSELEAKSVDLEKQIDDLKDSLAKQTEITDSMDIAEIIIRNTYTKEDNGFSLNDSPLMTGLFNEWKTHQQELLDVHRKLEELYKGSSPDTEERLPLLQRNLNVESIGDAMMGQLAASLAEEEFFCETKGTRAAMKHLIENKMVVIVGRKGNGKERLAQHLLFSLMSKSECQTNILDSVNDIRKCFKQKARETEIVLLHDVLIDKATKRTIKKLEEEIFKKSSNRYLIITSLYTTHLAGLSNLVNLSIREFQLSPSEKGSMLRSHLDRRSKATHVSKSCLLEREINEILAIECTLEFPLACALFTSEEKYYSKGVNFFRYPIDYFLAELRFLAKSADYKLFFELLLKQDGRSPLSFVNDNHKILSSQWDTGDRLREADLELSDLADLGEELSQQGILVHRISHTQKGFEFSNDKVEQAAQILLLETNFTKALEILSSDALLRCVITNPEIEESCHFEMRSANDQTRFAKKVLSDVFSGKVSHDIWDNNIKIWHSEDFVVLFVQILLNMPQNEESRRNVVSTILKKCAVNRLLCLCKALVKSPRTCHIFSRDYGKLLSQTLLDACQVHGNIAVLMELVNHKADLSFCTACVNASEKTHKCPLECAADAGDHETVHFLLQCGATVPHSKWKFWDFLKVAAESQDTFVCNVPFIKQLSRCCRSKGTYVNTTMEEFVERGLKLNPSIDYDRKQFFFDCLLLIGINDNLYHAFKTTVLQTEKLPADGQCENSCHKVLESFLDPDLEFRTLATLANVEFDMLNEKNKSGNTPLAKAVLLGKSHKILSQMLLLNANTDETDSNGRTALHLAIISSHPDLWVRKFVNTLAGPNICCKDIMDVTPVQLCMGKGRHRITTLRRLLEIQRKESALPTSLVHDCINMSLPEEDMLEILSVLKDIGVNPNTGDGCKCKPIARAAKHSHFNIVNALLQWNAEVDDIDSHENTLLHYCCFADARNGEKILDIYSKYHSKNVTTINRQNKVGRNAIMAYLADPSLTYSSNIIWRLLNMEPDLTIQDAEKNTALHYLMQSTLPDEEVLNFTQVMVNDFRVSISICNARSLSPLMAALSAKKSRYKTVKFILSLPEHQTPILSSEMGVLHHCITSCMADHEVHEISQTLIQHWGVSTNKPDVTGLSPLLASIQHSSSRCRTIALILKCSSGELCTGVLSELIKHSRLDVDVVQAMHKANIPIFKTVDQLGYSIFHFLIQNASHFHAFPELVASFLPFGHDINHIDSEGLSPLFHACRENYPESIVSSLLSNGARGHISTRKESALHICIRSKRNDSETMDIVSAILRSKTVEINTPDSYHTTALAEAISQGKLLTAKTLLENGADPNIPDRENRTVLHHSVAGNWSDQKTCAFLQLFLPVCQIDRHDGDDRSALNIAACHVSFSRIFSILKLLSAGSSNKTVDRLGRSPLHNTLRCLTGNLACCKLERLCRIEIFLSFSMSPICKDDDGETAIDACSKENMLDEIKLLNRKHKAIGLCEEIMSMLQLGEGNSDPGCLTFTEDIDKTVVNEDMHRILKEVAYNLHEINISIL